MNTDAKKVFTPLPFGQIKQELQFALEQLPDDALKAWALRSAKSLGSISLRRGKTAAQAVLKLSIGLVKVASESALATVQGKLGEYMEEKKNALQQSTAELKQQSLDLWKDSKPLRRKLVTQPSEVAPEVLGMGLGFLAGSGGLDADGGIPDLDFMAGIGAHRSIFTHSLLAGAVVETLVMASLDLVELVYQDLPEEHHAIWDAAHKHTQRFGQTFIRATDLGLAYHIGIDGSFDGMTPYKDLPIALPMEGHRAILLGNSAALAHEAIKKKKN